MSNVKEKLCLDRIPHFTTLQKFVSRIPSSLFNLVLSRTLKLSYSHGENASITAIDATEFTSSYAVIIILEEQGSSDSAFTQSFTI